MKFGASLPLSPMRDAVAMRDYAQALDGAGFDVLTSAGHLLAVPANSYTDRPQATYAGPFTDPFVAFAYLAAITQRVHFRPNILILPLYPTAIVAKQAAEIQELSGGRFELAVGISWNAAEYEAVGVEFHSRGHHLAEQVEVLRKFWTEPYVTFSGRWHTLNGVGLNRVLSTPIPIWIGGADDRVLRRAARLADGFTPLGDPTDALPKVQGYLREAGREPGSFDFGGRVVAGPGGPAAWIEAARRLEGLGVTQIALSAPPDMQGDAALQRMIEARQVLAGELGELSVVTIADVAQAAGVSIATVSRVLSPGAVPHPVRADTADRVREAARQLNFIPSPLARGLAARRSGLLGLIVPDLGDPHYPQIAIGVEDGAREASLAALICNTLGDIQRLVEYLQLLQARRVDAVVLSGATSMNAVELMTLQRWDVPMVLIGRPATQVQWPHVSIDNRLGARLATRHLLELGRQRIVHLSGPRTQTTMADRVRGYTDEMTGREVDIVESNGTPEDGYAQLALRFERRPAPDAVFAATDRLAIAALGVAADRSLHVPGDVAVVGFDDVPLAAQLRPTLSSVAQPAYELGSVAVDMARQVVAGEDVPPRVLAPRLVERQSTLGPGGRFTP